MHTYTKIYKIYIKYIDYIKYTDYIKIKNKNKK